MRSILAFIAIALVALSCTDTGTGPENRRFNLLFRYGVGARNELNTFNNTYTKDLIVDGTRTIRLVLSQGDFDIIESTLLEAGIFTYPDTFNVQHGGTVAWQDPFDEILSWGAPGVYSQTFDGQR